MTNYEFEAHYDKLIAANAKGYSSPVKKEAVKKAIKNLDDQWFVRAVQKIVTEAKANVFLDIEVLAKYQRNAEIRIADTKQFIHEVESSSENVTQEGYQKFLSGLGVTNAVDAIKKIKGGYGENN